MLSQLCDTARAIKANPDFLRGRRQTCVRAVKQRRKSQAHSSASRLGFEPTGSVLHLSASRSQELKHWFRQQRPSPFQKETREGLNEVACSQPKATQKHHPFQASGYTQKAPTCTLVGYSAWQDTGRDALASSSELGCALCCAFVPFFYSCFWCFLGNF